MGRSDTYRCITHQLQPPYSISKGKIWLDGTQKQDLVEHWNQIVRDNNLDIRTQEPLTNATKHPDGMFLCVTPKGEYHASKIVLAAGQRGNPCKLGVSGEDREQVYRHLYSPTKHRNGSLSFPVLAQAPGS